MTENLSPERRQRQELYDYIYSHPMVQQLVDGYNRTKQNSGFIGRAIGVVEDHVTDVATKAVPLYEQYLLSRVDAVHFAVNKSVENTKRVVEATTSTALTTTTIGIGAAVVVSQLILSLGVAGTNWLIDSIVSVRQVGGNAVDRMRETEKMLEERFKNYVERAHGIAQAPISKVTDQANIFLDIADGVLYRFLGIKSEPDPKNSTIGNRLFRMVTRFSELLQSRAHDNVIDPITNQMSTALEQLSSYMK